MNISNKKIRVLIVEDSPAVIELLKAIIGDDPRLEVAAAVETGERALEIVPRLRPDVISLDIRLPGINGFEVTQWVMQNHPTPIVVVSASVESEELKISMNALRAGALAVVEKPLGVMDANFENFARRICDQLYIMSEIKVVKQRLPRSIRFPGNNGAPPPSPPPAVSPSPVPSAGTGSINYKLLCIAASTGGPNAILEVLSRLPEKFPLPILLVQHITQSFLDGFVAWLDSMCSFKAVMLSGPTVPRPGHIYMAGPDTHLVVKGGKISMDGSAEVCRQRPSANVLFHSVARQYGPSSLAVLLTGMGEDGAEGLKAIKDAGGYTIAEDESSAVVFGMPRAAIENGGACEALPVQRIAPRILQLIPGFE